MSIYTIKQLIIEIGKLNEAQAKTALIRIVSTASSPKKRSEYAACILAKRTDLSPTVYLTDDRPISRVALDGLIGSPMLEYTKEIIEAALDPRGPFQSRDILMLADQIKGGRAFFITANGIPQNYKNEAGLILSMAGFERVSHYSRERKTPIKAWRSRKDFRKTSVEMRMDMVFTALKDAGLEEAPQPKPRNILESYI